MELIENIGPLLGIAAFLGFAALVFLVIQQGREVRRLRDWAGRAPERAAAAAARQSEGAEAARGAEATSKVEDDRPGAVARFRGRLGARLSRIGRRLPLDPRYLLTGGALILIAAVIATSGFGLLGGESEGGDEDRERSGPLPAGKTEVAVLNATQEEGLPGVAGLADRVGADVKAAGFELGSVTNADAGVPESVVMYASGRRAEARRASKRFEDLLGPIGVEPMTADIEDKARGADIALVVGQDDNEL